MLGGEEGEGECKVGRKGRESVRWGGRGGRVLAYMLCMSCLLHRCKDVHNPLTSLLTPRVRSSSAYVAFSRALIPSFLGPTPSKPFSSFCVPSFSASQPATIRFLDASRVLLDSERNSVAREMTTTFCSAFFFSSTDGPHFRHSPAKRCKQRRLQLVSAARVHHTVEHA